MWITDQVTEICVDDFAFRKGATYGTLIIDSSSHMVIDMIDSRERQDVAAKPAEYPNLKVVSRDGSPTYAAAITQADPQIMQVSDRFHLLKGLTEASKCVIQGLFKANIAIKKPEADVLQGPSEYNSTYWEKPVKEDAAEKRHQRNLAKKKEVVNQVRELDRQGLKVSETAKKSGLCRATVEKYIQKDYEPESAGYGKKQPSRLKPYEGKIKEMPCLKYKFREIEEELRREGYTGASSTIRMYATRERRLIKQAAGIIPQADTLERKWLEKLLYKPMDKIQGIDAQLVGKLLEEYPIVQDIYDLAGSFREILFSRKAEDLDNWLAEVDHLEIDELTSFANGLRKDLDAVKNAASHDYNNGLAEGSVNKVKLAKRKMYGRCSFETLRKKVLLREQYKNAQ
ncbi:MAG: ISL3 family transposase [Eubacterium sp.]|nr:ISL3 family transposase [Eubacterium sp.]